MKNATVFLGAARFEDAATVRVNAHTLRRIKSSSTSETGIRTPLCGIAQTPFLTNSTMMEVDFYRGTSSLSEQLRRTGIRANVPPFRLEVTVVEKTRA